MFRATSGLLRTTVFRPSIAQQLRFASKERAGKCIRPGAAIVFEGEPMKVLRITQGKRGKGGGYVRAVMKSLVSGNSKENTFTSDETVELADLEKETVTFSWTDGMNCMFMNNETYEEVSVPTEEIDGAEFLIEGLEAKTLKFGGSVIGVILPNSYEYTITDVDPSKSSSNNHLAVLDCGATVYVPTFLGAGIRVKINIADRCYIEKASK